MWNDYEYAQMATGSSSCVWEWEAKDILTKKPSQRVLKLAFIYIQQPHVGYNWMVEVYIEPVVNLSAVMNITYWISHVLCQLR